MIWNFLSAAALLSAPAITASHGVGGGSSPTARPFVYGGADLAFGIAGGDVFFHHSSASEEEP